MRQNLKQLQAFKWEVDGVKLRPYLGLKSLLHPPPPMDQPHPPKGETKTVSHPDILASFLMDKQLHKMLKVQTPLSVGSTIFRDVLEKMDLKPLIQKHLIQTCYLDIAFLQTRPAHEVKSQRTIQRDLEMKTIQSVTTIILRSLPTELFSRITFDKILESVSTSEVESIMDDIAAKMAWKSTLDTEEIKRKFSDFLDEIKQPSFNWPIKYAQAEKFIKALDICWESDEYINYVLDYVADIWFHVTYHAKLVIHCAPWIAVDKELVNHVNKQLKKCPWSKSLPPRQQLDQPTCNTVMDMAHDNELIKVPVVNFVETNKGSRVFDLDVLGALFNEDMFKHQTDLAVPSEYDESAQAQQVVDANNAILAAQDTVNQADSEAFQSGEITNDVLQLAQQDLKQVPPCSTLTRFGKASRITIRSAVAAAQQDQTPRDLHLMSLFTLHLQPAEDRESTSFLSQLAVGDDLNTQRILVNTKSSISAFQPDKVPVPCLYEARVSEKKMVDGTEKVKTVYRKCHNFACMGLPVCPLHLHTLAQLGRHDKYTPGN